MAGSLSFSEQRKQRIEQRSILNSPGEIVSDRTYNPIIGLTVAWGLLINVIMCNTCYPLVKSINPLLFFVVYIGCLIAGTVISQKSDNPLVSFGGYNLVVLPLGLLLTIVVNTYGGISSSVVTTAFFDTLIITAIMIGLSLMFPTFFSKLGKILFGCLIGLLVASIITLFLGTGYTLVSLGCAALFSFYIGYDFWRSQQYAKTVDNAVDSAVDIYVDIVMLLVQLIQIFGRR